LKEVVVDFINIVPLPEDEADANREIYAYFGLAMYLAQVLEHCVINAIFFIDFIPSALKEGHTKATWAEAVDSHFDRRYKDVFGKLINQLLSTGKIPDNIKEELEKSRKARNRLAHDFFRDHDVSWFSQKGKESMYEELREAANLFIATDALLSTFLVPFEKKAGLTEKMVKEYAKKMREGLF
jgi:hypothetical protein